MTNIRVILLKFGYHLNRLNDIYEKYETWDQLDIITKESLSYNQIKIFYLYKEIEEYNDLTIHHYFFEKFFLFQPGFDNYMKHFTFLDLEVFFENLQDIIDGYEELYKVEKLDTLFRKNNNPFIESINKSFNYSLKEKFSINDVFEQLMFLNNKHDFLNGRYSYTSFEDFKNKCLVDRLSIEEGYNTLMKVKPKLIKKTKKSKMISIDDLITENFKDEDYTLKDDYDKYSGWKSIWTVKKK